MTARNRDNLHGLGKMILLRLITIVISTIVVSFIIFWLADFSPFDPLAHYLGANYGDYTEAERAKIATALGIDTPWWQQWLTWWKDVLSGNLGWSRVYSKPVGTVISERLPWTLLLSAAGLALTMVFSLVLGAWSARHPDGLLDRAINALGVFLAATPSYVYALGTVLLFGVFIHAISVGGAAPIGQQPSLGTIGPYLIAPAIVLAISQMSWPLLAMQQSVRETLASPAVVASKLRGLKQQTILVKHILPMSLMPLITLIGARLGELIVGAVIIETVFSWPGLASATIESAVAVDFPLLALVTTATTIVVMLGSLASDVCYMLIDPRIRDV